MTGDHVAHPLLIGLANIKMSTRLKLSSNSFMLTALLLVPKFIHEKKRMRGVLEDRLIHQCLDIVLEPIKAAARLGIMMSDPNGHNRYCFTPLAGYIADTPEAAMLAAVGGKTSPVTMAMYKQFGDSFRHEPRTGSTTLAQLHVVRSRADPQDIEAFFREAQKFRLNGVYEPFWRNLLLSCPSRFLTPEVLHYLHKMFWDHDVKWCVNAVGASELDFRFSVLQPIAGFRHYKGSISKLKQVTGSVHRDLQRYLIGVIAGVLSSDFVIALRSLMDFRYRAQAYIMDEDDLRKLERSLADFHSHKNSILVANARHGKGNQPIDNWYIPKLELMQNIVPSVRRSGVAIQWTADVTEHTHITEIKDPARQSNNNNYDPQICHYLDRKEKLRRFELATTFRQLAFDIIANEVSPTSTREGKDSDDDQESEGELDNGKLGISFPALSRPLTDYFAIARLLASSVGATAFHLSSKPSVRRMSVQEATEMFQLPDLPTALLRFAAFEKDHGPSMLGPVGGHRRTTESILPFDELQIWFKLHMQGQDFHRRDQLLPAQMLFCAPPSISWPFGRYDTALAATTPNFTWPDTSLRSMCQLYLAHYMTIASCYQGTPLFSFGY